MEVDLKRETIARLSAVPPENYIRVSFARTWCVIARPLAVSHRVEVRIWTFWKHQQAKKRADSSSAQRSGDVNRNRARTGIDSSRPTIPMMKATDLRHRDDPPDIESLHFSLIGRVSIKRQMRS